ncbi:TPA: hypothetical protein EYP44_00445 [Candidatus Bathyarchaeota archaeon]|nr:hypothetical protein [Candidatus Bathyarchaeota archaeon]
MKRRSGSFVVPGTRLGVCEEFMAGPGTYVRNDVVYSKITGYVLFNLAEKKVSVYPAVHLHGLPKKGRVGFGRILSVRDRFALVEIFQVGRKRVESRFTGLLPITLAGRRGANRATEMFKPGDIIRCKIVSSKDRIRLSTAGSRLGVVLGLSSCCGQTLNLQAGKLVCPRCGREERRKTAIDYGRLPHEGRVY